MGSALPLAAQVGHVEFEALVEPVAPLAWPARGDSAPSIPGPGQEDTVVALPTTKDQEVIGEGCSTLLGTDGKPGLQWRSC